MSLKGSLAGGERLDWLAGQLEQSGSIAIGDAASALGVSEMTIRRDLDELEERGAARRVRGGARAIGPQTFDQRHDLAGQAKSHVAAKLRDLLPSTGAIALDASSTVLRLTAFLDDARDLHVLTNGPDSFAAMQDQPGLVPLLTGGRLDPRTGSFVGPLACRAASQIAVDRFFTSAAAVTPDGGPREATLEDADVKRAMAEAANEVILAIDSTKLGQRAMATSIPWDDVDLLVTELDPDHDRLDPYRNHVEIR